MQYYVYILTNKTNYVTYIGVTNDLEKRVYQHKNDIIEGFTKKYRVHKLVYYESTTDIRAAIAREKQLKGWNRAKKSRSSIRLITAGATSAKIYVEQAS